MKAKLIKVGNDYFLKVNDTKLATSVVPNLSASIRYSLSLKNCQAIERGYDLDELALEAFELDLNCQGDCNNYYERLAYKLGMIKMIKLLGDKKFSEEDMKKAYLIGCDKQTTSSYHVEKNIQSLQQTEWEVEIVTKESEQAGENVWVNPKLDVDGCIVLKRKI